MNLEEIEARLNQGYDGRAMSEAFVDIRALLAEVERLRAALLDATCDCGPYTEPDVAKHGTACRYVRVAEEHKVARATKDTGGANGC